MALDRIVLIGSRGGRYVVSKSGGKIYVRADDDDVDTGRLTPEEREAIGARHGAETATQAASDTPSHSTHKAAAAAHKRAADYFKAASTSRNCTDPASCRVQASLHEAKSTFHRDKADKALQAWKAGYAATHRRFG